MSNNEVTPELLAAYVAGWNSARIYNDCVDDIACRRSPGLIGRHCPECLAHLRAVQELQVLTKVSFWSPTGLADQPDPPRYVVGAKACAAWRRSWRLHLAVRAEAWRQGLLDPEPTIPIPVDAEP